jgi:hypothetical protein
VFRGFYDTSEELIGKTGLICASLLKLMPNKKQAYSKVMSGEMEREYYENEVVTKSGKRKLIYWNNQRRSRSN